MVEVAVPGLVHKEFSEELIVRLCGCSCFLVTADRKTNRRSIRTSCATRATATSLALDGLAPSAPTTTCANSASPSTVRFFILSYEPRLISNGDHSESAAFKAPPGAVSNRAVHMMDIASRHTAVTPAPNISTGRHCSSSKTNARHTLCF